MNHLSHDDFDCIGGEGWYNERCSKNFLISVLQRLFTDDDLLSHSFRPDTSIRLGNIQHLRLTEEERKNYYEIAKNFMLRASSGILRQRHDTKYEIASFSELSLLVFMPSPYEELFVRRNSLLKMIHRILRSAQSNHASLRPAYPGSLTCCTCGSLPHAEYCPAFDVYDSERSFYYPPLKPGDRVVRGPDWQWNTQGDNGEGTVQVIKSWKSSPMGGVSVLWDNGDNNVYRYGADNSYDVVISDPMMRDGFTLPEGLLEPSETDWNDYVYHYVAGGVSKGKGFFSGYIVADRLALLLPTYARPVLYCEETAAQAFEVINELLSIVETDIMEYFNGTSIQTLKYTVSKHVSTIIQTVLFPFQLYAFSQAEGDVYATRTESLVLESYLLQLLSLCIRIITKTITKLLEKDAIPDIMDSLEVTPLGQLLPYVLSFLYVFNYSHHICHNVQSDVEDLALLWCKLLNICHIHYSYDPQSEFTSWQPPYSPTYQAPFEKHPWYITLLFLITSVSTRYHYSCRLNNYIEQREDVRCLVESYVFSGGLLEEPSSQEPSYSFISAVYENELSEYEQIHTWMDRSFPEPAWKRNRQPIQVNLELKYFAALVYLTNGSDLLKECFTQLIHKDETPAIPEHFKFLWRYVITFREHLRKKKQEFQHMATVDVEHASSMALISSRKSSLNVLRRSDSSQYSMESHASNHAFVAQRRCSLKTLFSSYTSGEVVTNPIHNPHEIPVEPESPRPNTIIIEDYEDYVDIVLQKFDLLLSLNKPWDLNEEQDQYQEDAFIQEGQKRILSSIKKNNSLVIEEKGVIPSSVVELICSCVSKFLYNTPTVTCDYLMKSLRHRTENAQNKKRIFDEGLDFLQMISSFPQASRLFILGLFHETTVFSNLCTGYHHKKRRHDGNYSMDYLENCEGASHSVMKSLIQSIKEFCEYLKSRFIHCVENLYWRFGSAIVWFLITIASSKLPYFPIELGLTDLFEGCSKKLSKWYEMTNGYSKEILVSPGTFWDSLSQKSITLASSHFNRLLNDPDSLKVNPQKTIIPGIFPASVMVLANSMRLGYTITCIQQFTDYISQSRASPAQNPETLYNWTVTDVSNLFIRQSIPYLIKTRSLFLSFMNYFIFMKSILKDRCSSWQPFAPINYSKDDTSINIYACIKTVDEKNIMRGMIATDMLISSAEGVLSSYLAMMLFLIHTRANYILPWKQFGNVLWDMLYFSPRHQKLASMLLQSIIPSTDFIPPVFEDTPHCFFDVVEGTPDTDTIMKNPFLYPPVFPQALETTPEKREAFIYYLLHLASHSDGCPGALVGERTSCALCCDFFPFIYNTMCPSSSCYRLPNKDSFIRAIEGTPIKVFVSSCKMHIRPDGHTASFCSLVFAEEVVYLLRCMMREPAWCALMMNVFRHIFEFTALSIEKEKDVSSMEVSDNQGFHKVLRKRTPWFCMSTAVLKVLGAITPRMYAGSRIRIHEFLMDGENDVSTLIHTAYQSRGTGSIIKYNRSMGEALVLMDKIDTPVYVNNYVFDVVDRIEPPHDVGGNYSVFLQFIMRIIENLPLCQELFTLPTQEMPFFNTSDLPLSPSELQNSILNLYCIRCINHMLITNNSLATEITPTFFYHLLSFATRPLPCTISFNTLIIRQYFNWFIEYLVDTYPGSARLLPMELQTEEVTPMDSFNDCFGVGKEEYEEDDDKYGKPIVIRNEKRMKHAEELAASLHCDEFSIYRVLQTFNDNEALSIDFINKHSREELYAICNASMSIPDQVHAISDDSVITDMELGIRKLQVASNTHEKVVTDTLISTVLPPYTSLQHITTENMRNMNSIYGVVASVTSKSLLYTPFPETGVITKVSSSSGVTLSSLNVNSGILEENVYPAETISLHKHRLLYYLGNVKLLRGVAGRICCNLTIKYLRELIICLIYYCIKNHVDVLEFGPSVPQDLITLTKYTYTSYLNSMILNPSKHNHVTLVSCIFKILIGCIKKLMCNSPYGIQLFNALIHNIWDDRKNNDIVHKRTVSSPSLSSYRTEMVLLTPTSPTNEDTEEFYVSSLHPCLPRTKYYDRIIVAGAAGLRVIFDNRCCLDADYASLTFYRDEENTDVIARFTGDASNFCSFAIRGNTLRFLFESGMQAKETWGYGFLIQPLENIQWSGDKEVLEKPCFDWNCYALNIAIDVSMKNEGFMSTYFVTVFNNLLTYLRTSGMPFKTTVVDLLIKLSHLPLLKSKNPDVTGIYNVVIKYGAIFDANSIVPSQLPLLIEFLESHRLEKFKQLTSGKESYETPFDPLTPDLGDTLSDKIDSVYILTQCLCSLSCPPQQYLKQVLKACNKRWVEEEYIFIQHAYKRFSHKLDLQLLSCFDAKSVHSNTSLLEYNVLQFKLDEDDKARYYALSSFSNTEVRLRLALIQFYNQQLLQVMHLIELVPSRENDYNTLGKYISLITGYIFLPVKETFLQLSINQTIYHGKDCYPVIELDNRRVFTDMEKSSSFEEERNALTSQCTFAQLYRQMKVHNTDCLRAPLDSKDRLMAIKYKGEQGLDWGGLYHDTIERCVEDLFSDHIDLFIPCPNSRNEEGRDEKFLPNPKYRESNDILGMYTFVGNLIGISLRTKQLMSIELCSAIWKTIVGDTITVEDVEAVDSEFMNTLKQVKEYKESDGKEDFTYLFGLTYSVLDSAGNEVEIIPSGSQVSVTFDSRMHFYELALDYRLNEWKQAAEAIAAGVYALIPRRALSLFTWEQLERAVKGVPEISIELLQKHTVYEGWSAAHPVVCRFWRVLSELTSKDRSLFLRFTWGRSRLPKNAEDWPRSFKLCRKDDSDEMLPTAHTCFFQLDLPEYSTDAIMRERLLVAIHFGAGEFMLR